MIESPKQSQLYSEERAAKEALKMQGKIKSGEAKDYSEAEKIVGKEKKEQKRINILAEKEREEERLETDKQRRAENHKKYGYYNENVYKIIDEIFREKEISTRAWNKKLKRFHQLPAEAVFIFKKLKAENISINDLPPDLLKAVLRRAFDLIDRKNDYDKDLAQRIGHQELLRWRNNEELQNGDSFKKIIATLREHAVVKAPKTKIGQKPRVTFQPKGDYHKNENL